MDGGIANPDELLDGLEAAKAWSPSLTLAGFSGTLDHLLTLARSQNIDLAEISLTALVDQLSAALQRAPATTPLGQKADWVVMAAWLVQLRAGLLLPADSAPQQAATAQADQLRRRLMDLQAMQALALWLERRPQLGHEVFARGRPEALGVSVETMPVIDVVEFLWASLALFDDAPSGLTTVLYRPYHLDLFAVADARERILRRLAEPPGKVSLEHLLPEVLGSAEPHKSRASLRSRSAWSSTLVASLELAKQGHVALDQCDTFQSILVSGVQA